MYNCRMQTKEKIDKLSKIADIVNKKLIVLLAIDGGVGAYSIKFIEQANYFGYMLGVIFVVVSVLIISHLNVLLFSVFLVYNF